MIEKIKLIIMEIIIRLKSPVVWAGIIAIVGLVFATAGYSLTDVPTWADLGKISIEIISNPAKIALIVVALFGFLNNPSDKDKF